MENNTLALIRIEPRQSQEVGPLLTLMDSARGFMSSARSRNTVRGYRSDWRQFSMWCAAHSVSALPATSQTLLLYLTAMIATHKVATLTRCLSAISQVHQTEGLESPTTSMPVRTLMAGIRRSKGTAPAVKSPALTADIRRMVAALPPGLLGMRDRALLLVGFAGAFRRSELVGLNREDLEFANDGLVVLLRRSKTDQEGAGRKVAIAYGSNPETCPVHALQAWLEASGISEGPIFRAVNRHGQVLPGRLSAGSVAIVVKRYATAAGLDAAKYAGHSLRAGLATSGAIAGASERSIMNQTGHRSVQMVRRYIREGSLWRENVSACVGL